MIQCKKWAANHENRQAKANAYGTNNMGRMYGSSRFMSLEEFQLGATVALCQRLFYFCNEKVIKIAR